MGDNGAGKSTLVKIIAGNFPQSGGSMRWGPAVHFHKPSDARAAGIEIVYQDLALCDNLTAAENVFLGRELMRGFGPHPHRSTTARCSSARASCSPS
jgi:simple sugar transport system ATP-binding protein